METVALFTGLPVVLPPLHITPERVHTVHSAEVELFSSALLQVAPTCFKPTATGCCGGGHLFGKGHLCSHAGPQAEVLHGKRSLGGKNTT